MDSKSTGNMKIDVNERSARRARGVSGLVQSEPKSRL